MAFKKNMRKPRRKVLRRPRRKNVVAKGNFKQKVLSVIRSRTESKQAFTTFTPTDFNGGINSVADICRVIPTIGNGTQDYQRVGDQIIAQKLTIRGIVQMLPQGNAQGDGLRKIAARIMIVTPKAYPTWNTATSTATWQSALLKKGGTTVGFTGDISDLYAPINTDAITCHYNKVHFFNQGSFYQATGTAGNGPVSFEQNNMVRFWSKTFNFKNKVLKYDTNVDSGLTPTNAGMFLIMGYTFVDGTSPDIVSVRVRLQYDATLDYEDA